LRGDCLLAAPRPPGNPASSAGVGPKRHLRSREEGAKAIAEAAHKALAFEKNNDTEQAQTWRRIEAALIEIRGPRNS
jgi:hypothetical protein